MEGLIVGLPRLIEVLLPILTVFLLWVGRVIVKKLNLQNNAHADQMIESLVRRAIDAVEQMAKFAQKEGEVVLSSGDKLAKAVSIIEAELKLLRLPQLASALIQARVEAYLGMKASWEEEIEG